MGNPTRLIVPGLVLAVVGVACFVAVADLPYSCYRLLRWMVSAAGVVTVVEAARLKRYGWAWGFGFLVLIFNPVAPFYFDKSVWRVADVIAGATFLAYLVRRPDAKG